MPASWSAPGPVARFVRRRPLLTFYLWFFTVGQAIVFIPLLARRTWGAELPDEPFIITASFLGLLLPALVVTWITDGPDGLRALRRRALAFRTPARWYVLVVIGVPLVALAGAAAVSGVPHVSGSSLTTAFTVGFLVQLVAVFVTVNLWEEVAWMGLVQARLQEGHGAIRAAAMTGPLFALGHISQLIGDSMSASLIMVALLMVVSIPFRALQGWVYNRTDSLFLVGLVHAATNAAAAGSVLGVGMLDHLYPDEGTGGLVIPLLAVVGLIVVAATRGRLGDRTPTDSATVSAPEPSTARP